MITIHMLAFEMMEKREFKKGSIIMRQNKRSKVNSVHSRYMEPQQSVVLVKVLKEREAIDKFGIDRRVSTWSLVMKNIT